MSYRQAKAELNRVRQQILDESTTEVSAEIMGQLMHERLPPDIQAALMGHMAVKTIKHNPLPDDSQMTMFTMTGWVMVHDADNRELLKRADTLTAPELKAELRRRGRGARTELERADRGIADIEKVEAWEHYSPALPYNEQALQYAKELGA
jgi:hypothetical protein